MKKVLLASTALAFSAGVAAAEVSLSGYAEIGVGGTDAPNSERFHHDLDVTFTMSGETDGGLTFGATIDLDEVSNGIGPDDGLTSGNPGSVFVSGDFGTITMGDTDGAFDWAMTEASWGTTIADDHSTHAGFSGNSGLDGGGNGQVARYEYSFGDFAFAASAEITPGDDIFGIGAKYSADFGGTAISLGIGAQSGDFATGAFGLLDASTSGVGFSTVTTIELSGTADIVGISIGADFAGGFSVIANYSTLDGTITNLTGTVAGTSGGFVFGGTFTSTAGASPHSIDIDHYALGVAYAMDALLIEANYGKSDVSVSAGAFGPAFTAELEGYGVSVNYDLGGGAKVAVGYGSSTVTESVTPSSTDSHTWSAGLVLSF